MVLFSFRKANSEKLETSKARLDAIVKKYEQQRRWNDEDTFLLIDVIDQKGYVSDLIVSPQRSRSVFQHLEEELRKRGVNFSWFVVFFIVVFQTMLSLELRSAWDFFPKMFNFSR